jgi:hypothetical protein
MHLLILKMKFKNKENNMKKNFSNLIGLCMLALINTKAQALSDDVEIMMESYLPKLQRTWMEVKTAKSTFSGKYTMPREYVAVTNLEKGSYGAVTLHIRKDYPDDSQGYASIVNTYFVDCKHSKQRYVGVTTYDRVGNVIGQNFSESLNKIEQPYAFAESPQGLYCSGELIINLLTQGGFLDAQDQAKLDMALQETRDRQVRTIEDRSLEIPKLDIEKYKQLEKNQEDK